MCNFPKKIPTPKLNPNEPLFKIDCEGTRIPRYVIFFIGAIRLAISRLSAQYVCKENSFQLRYNSYHVRAYNFKADLNLTYNAYMQNVHMQLCL